MSANGAFRPTPQQEVLLRAGVCDLLVSAAAGSGKTQVMTDRIVKRIAEGALDIRQVLVMTFTDAAAANLRRKIVEKLRAAAEGAPKDEARRLRRQAGLLPHASISTIHGFCLEVLRSSSYQAVDAEGKPLLEPGFRVADAAEAEILRLEALDRVFERRYLDAEPSDGSAAAPEAEGFLDLVDAYGDHRGDAKVRSLVLSVHTFLRSMPAYRTWAADRLQRLAHDVAAFGSSEGARLLLGGLKDLLSRADEVIPDMLASLDEGWTFAADADRDREWRDAFRATLVLLRGLSRRLADRGSGTDSDPSGDWDEAVAVGRRIPIEALPKNSKNAPPERSAFVASFRTHLAEPVHCLTGRFGGEAYRKEFTAPTRHLFHESAEAIGRGIAPTVPLCTALFQLVLDVDDRYADLKRKASVIDFSDIEHLALSALEREGADGAFRTRFQEIYVDEYQDTSGIQEAIVECLARGNRFLVGDVKQSIYRFRHARPEIFQEKAERYARDVPPGQEETIGAAGVLRELNRNFRSTPAVLAAANLVFDRIMSREAGEVAYDATQALVPDREDPPGGRLPVELVLVDAREDATPAANAEESAAEDEETGETPADPAPANGDVEVVDPQELKRQVLEARWIAGRIRELAEEARAAGKETRYAGIAVLSRTRAVAAGVSQALKDAGIPVEEDPTGEFLASPELRTMESLVNLLDNPRQDIPLAAVMQSMLYPEPFSEDEMLRIRLVLKKKGGRDAFFHEAVAAFRDEGEPEALRQRVVRFLDWVADLRGRAVHSGLDALIGHIYLSTGFLDRVSRMPDGSERVADLRMFHEWAGSFESTRMRGLYGFARYIERMREKGGGDVVRGARPGGADAVVLATFHGSKGLEYPVVFLAGLASAFRLSEKQDRVIVSEALGIGPDVVDLAARTVYPSHLKLAVWEHSRRAMLAEEMRLLYVAMTRAMDRLFLVASTKSKPDAPDARLVRIVEEAAQRPGEPVPSYQVLSAKNHLEWLLQAFASEFPAEAASLLGIPASSAAPRPAGPPDPAALPYWTARRVFPSEVPAGPTAAGFAATAPVPAPAPNPDAPSSSTKPETTTARPDLPTDYRFAGSSRAPAKISVSELKRRTAPELEGEPGEPAQDDDGPLPPDRVADPADEDGRRLRVRFGALKSVDLEMKDLPMPVPAMGDGTSPGTRALPPNEVGTAVHSVLRYLDLAAAAAEPTADEILRQIDRQLSLRKLTADEAAAARGFASSVAAFAASGLARRILASGARVFREIPFTLSASCGSLYAGVPDAGAFAPEDRVMVQGIIDLWFVEDGYGVLVDYKTDRIEGSDEVVAETLRRRYAAQLDYYAQAVEASTGVHVAERVLWLVRKGKAYRT